jgi:hypothetical protein
MWGGSGGSGGAKCAGVGVPSSAAVSGSTGAGGYLIKALSGLTSGNTLTFTCGAAGAAGTNVPGNGGNGTASILASGTQTIATLTANGSNGSAGANNTASAGTAAGTTSGGDFAPKLADGQQGAVVMGYDSTSASNFGYAAYEMGPGVSPASAGAAGASVAGSGAQIVGNPGNPGGMTIEWFT